MERFYCLFILCFLCISLHLLILQVMSDDADNLVADSCNSTKPSINCTALGNTSFIIGALCESLIESFLKSNCSSDQVAYWNAFQNATSGTMKLDALPALTGIYSLGNYITYISLAWDMAVVGRKACDKPQSAASVDTFVPEVINLTTFANGAFSFSPYNLYLLFNCNNTDSLSTMANLTKNSPICEAYLKQCNNNPVITSCVQLNPFQELTLEKVLNNLSCSHFHSLVNNTPLRGDVDLLDWSTGMVQLMYEGGMCEACGRCFLNETTVCQFSKTVCDDGRCNGFSCTIVKIVTGVTTTVAAIAFCMMLCFCINHRRKFRYSTKLLPTSSSNSRVVTQRAYMLSKKFGPVDAREFSFETLSNATESFADENMIGDGGFGAVYLGILGDGCKVAIKRLYHDNFRRMDHFYNEIKILSSIDHPNLVKLHGFCCEDSRDLLLVFEYASNGTVFDQLHDDTKPAMPWKTRLNIARETAEALAYLHSSKTPPIYHRDVKTTNILLDDDLGVKLADFGLSRLVPLEVTHLSTAPQGTPGYLDPEYQISYQLTDKSDVYSFGVVLVELLSAKLAVDMSRDRREINLSSLALMKIGCGAWKDLVDPRLEMKENPDVEMMAKRVIEIAFTCLNAEQDYRPTMKCVAETLESMCNEFGYGSGAEYNALSFRMMVMNGL